MRAVGIVAIVVYGAVLVTGYKKSKVNTTESITKDMKVRNKNFYNSKDYKNNLTLPKQVVENNNETVAKEMEQAKPAETVDLQKNSANSNKQKADAKAADEAKKKEEQAKLEAQKSEMQKVVQQKAAEQKRQEEAKLAARQAEIKKQQQIEAARKEQAVAQARAEAARQRAKEEAAKKAKEEAAKRARENAKKHQGPKKYIQVASVTTEASARGIAKRLGGNFYYKKTTVNGKTAYVVMSNMTDNPNTLKAMENQAKRAGGGYMIRSVGK
jgi:putative tolA protein